MSCPKCKMSIGWSEPELIENGSSELSWFKRKAKRVGKRCKYCNTVFVNPYDWLYRILTFSLGVVITVSLQFYANDKKVIFMLFGLWLLGLVITIIISKDEEL